MKLKINNVGRISKGEIEPKPLTMFVGQNDSGKTYAASTMWALLRHINRPETRAFTNNIPGLKDFISTSTGGDSGHFEFSAGPKDVKKIRDNTVKSFNKNIDVILQDAIGYDGFSDSKISLEGDDSSSAIKLNLYVEKFETIEEVEVEVEDEEESYDIEIQTVDRFNYSCKVEYGTTQKELFSYEDLELDIFAGFIESNVRQSLIGISCFGLDWLGMRNVIYLPAARTGIMLALDYFVSGTLDRSKMAGKELEESGTLPRPIQDFALNLSRRTFRPFWKKRDHHLGNLIQGEFSRRSHTRGDYVYSIENGKGEIPLASTSSLVTELAALSVLSHRVTQRTLLIFEEPEAHLHLSAQREMARSLAKMVNSGIKVLITTHSDTFLQQLNNLISLHHLKGDRELIDNLGVPEDSIIDPKDIAAFDFDCVDGITNIEKLEITKHGVVANSLNRVLLELADETIRINDALSNLET
ncbi:MULTISPECIES: AAA family ATPase [unclassified Leisingera]|uniref:AAA family ATPase n=1 Tax=unclassified Leisingera TaxID=2614906 RepID=UPI00031B9A8A|nr:MULTISPECIES: AAA family ATPase [unclassified Leisingera]